MVPRTSDWSYIERFIIASTILAAYNVIWSGYVRFVSDFYPTRVSSWVVFVVLRLLAFLLKPGHVMKRLHARIMSCSTELDIQSPEHISYRTYFVEAWKYLKEFPESDKYYTPFGPDGKPFVSQGNSEDDEAEVLLTQDNWHNVATVLNRLGGAIFMVSQVLVFIFFMMPLYFGVHIVPPATSDSTRTQVVAGDKNITGNFTSS